MKKSNWFITKDHMTEKDGHSDVHKTNKGKYGLSFDEFQTCTIPFRIYDSDNILYYEGKASAVTKEILEWASYDAGATRIDFELNGIWNTI